MSQCDQTKKECNQDSFNILLFLITLYCL